MAKATNKKKPIVLEQPTEEILEATMVEDSEPKVEKRGGYRPGAGRKKGSHNKKPQRIITIPNAPTLVVRRPHGSKVNSIEVDNHSYTKDQKEIQKQFMDNFAKKKVLPCPDSLTGDNARLMWYSTMNAYAACEDIILSDLDELALVLLCNNWEKYCKCQVEIEEMGGRISSLAMDRDENSTLSMLHRTQNTAEQNIQKLMPQLWLTPEGRADTAKKIAEYLEQKKLREEEEADREFSEYA